MNLKRKFAGSRVRKWSIRIGRHNTSFSVEEEFWQALKEIAALEQLPLSKLFADIDKARTQANLSSTIRLRAGALSPAGGRAPSGGKGEAVETSEGRSGGKRQKEGSLSTTQQTKMRSAAGAGWYSRAEYNMARDPRDRPSTMRPLWG